MRLWSGLALLAVLPAAAAAQGVPLLGRVYDADTDAAVANAIVTVEGVGSTLTGDAGAFRFRGIEPGTYTLRVEAFSYAMRSIEVDVDGGATVEIALESAPLTLDSIVVEAGTVDYHGRVHDPVNDFYLVDAQAIVRGREPVWTDSHGRFDLDDLPEGVPVSVSVRAFGYLPIDTTFVPDGEGRYTFDLEADAFAAALVAPQIRKIEDRAGGRPMAGKGVMDRREILRYASGAHSVTSMLDFEYPQRTLDRILCTFIDEQQVGVNPTTGAEIVAFSLDHAYPEEIERMELLQFDTAQGRPLILQIYTRSFIMAMTTQDIPLKERTITPFGQCF
jgi:Carboxypeptidase regulatory-like domain